MAPAAKPAMPAPMAAPLMAVIVTMMTVPARLGGRGGEHEAAAKHRRGHDEFRFHQSSSNKIVFGSRSSSETSLGSDAFR
ncbi:MAG: hypothetical protein P8Y71_05835 [Pseudolabrys sp.]